MLVNQMKDLQIFYQLT